jgi:hypothetical protein
MELDQVVCNGVLRCWKGLTFGFCYQVS